jgi:hypothetical protein
MAAEAAAYQPRQFERAKLLQYTGSAGTHPFGDLVWGCGPAGPQRVQDLPPERRRGVARVRRRRGQRIQCPNASIDEVGIGSVLEMARTGAGIESWAGQVGLCVGKGGGMRTDGIPVHG